MKKIFTTILFLLILSNLKAQTNFNTTRSSLFNICRSVRTDTNKILSDRSINIFFSRKVASYLAGSNDLSLYKNYFVSDISDGSLFFGHNSQIYKPVNDRVSDLLTFGLKAKAKDNFATIFSAKEFAGDIGINLKYTHICRGKIWYDRKIQMQTNLYRIFNRTNSSLSQKVAMRYKRTLNYGKLNYQMQLDSTVFLSSISSITDTSYINPIKRKFFSDDEGYLKQFAEMEADEFEADNNSHNLSNINWFSISCFAPITNSKYGIADSIRGEIKPTNFRPWEGNILFTNIIESRRYGRLFTTFGVSAFLNNSAKNEDIPKYDINTYKQLGGKDTIKLAQLSTEEAFIGNYKTYLSTKISGQLIYFYPKLSWLGFSAKYEQFFGKYDPKNLKIGFPMVFQGKDEDSKINIELQLMANDIEALQNQESKKFNDIFQIGISIGLPFSSIIY